MIRKRNIQTPAVRGLLARPCGHVIRKCMRMGREGGRRRSSTDQRVFTAEPFSIIRICQMVFHESGG